MTIFFLGFILMTIGYALLILWLSSGWRKLMKHQTAVLHTNPLPSVTVVVAVRNEAENIENCLGDLLLQDYPPEKLEIIIVDDFSTDSTKAIVERILKTISGHISVNLLDSDSSLESPFGKKQALLTGITSSKSRWILTTDGDCRIPTTWVKTMLSGLNAETVMVLGPVSYPNQGNFFSQLQAVELLSLIGFTAAAAGNQRPIIANGANLGFKREVFHELGGYHNEAQIVSGDDVLLLHKVRAHNPTGIQFIPSTEASVSTLPEHSLSGFLNQRIRWASKSKYYQDSTTKGIGAFLLLFYIYWLTCGLISLFNPFYFSIFLGLNLAKLAFEYHFLSRVAQRLQQGSLLIWLLPLQFFYPLYITFTGVRSIGGTFYWKGRKHRA